MTDVHSTEIRSFNMSQINYHFYEYFPYVYGNLKTYNGTTTLD